MTFGIVSLVSVFSGCSEDDDYAPPVASFVITGSPAHAPAQIECTNTSINSFRHEWYVDGNGPTVGDKIWLTYYTAGSHEVELKAIGDQGESVATQWVYINPPHTTCKIKKIELISYPPPSSGTHDPGSGPDIYFIIDGAGSIYYNGLPVRFNDVTASSLPITWELNPSFSLGAITSNNFLTFHDYDYPDPDAYMGYFSFKPSYDWKFYPVNPVIEKNGLKVRFTLEWE